ncbi:MAG: hypothetical protein CMJ59_20000 [Planctomycetaceae bacterium]|nr:hypothetical protein [Planctomycetaceae bacterium]
MGRNLNRVVLKRIESDTGRLSRVHHSRAPEQRRLKLRRCSSIARLETMPETSPLVSAGRFSKPTRCGTRADRGDPHIAYPLPDRRRTGLYCSRRDGEYS